MAIKRPYRGLKIFESSWSGLDLYTRKGVKKSPSISSRQYSRLLKFLYWTWRRTRANQAAVEARKRQDFAKQQMQKQLALVGDPRIIGARGHGLKGNKRVQGALVPVREREVVDALILLRWLGEDHQAQTVKAVRLNLSAMSDSLPQLTKRLIATVYELLPPIVARRYFELDIDWEEVERLQAAGQLPELPAEAAIVRAGTPRAKADNL